jgi:hypothetical protein
LRRAFFARQVAGHRGFLADDPIHQPSDAAGGVARREQQLASRKTRTRHERSGGSLPIFASSLANSSIRFSV